MNDQQQYNIAVHNRPSSRKIDSEINRTQGAPGSSPHDGAAASILIGIMLLIPVALTISDKLGWF